MNLPAVSPLTPLDTAIANTRAFLLSAQDENGGWRDFLLPAGLSTSWVTAYVGEALLVTGQPDKTTIDASKRAWQFLSDSTVGEGGWSYNPTVPGDADSTIWGIRFASALDETYSDCAQRAISFLNTHYSADGGVKTYATAKPIRRYIGVPAFVPFKGWTQSHACVSAAAANLIDVPDHLIHYLLETQNRDGSWPAYFWFDNEYSTGEAVVALARFKEKATLKQPEVVASITRAAEWLRHRVESLVSKPCSLPPTFALACAARALARYDHNHVDRNLLDLAGRRLVEWQRENGSWGPTANLRVPSPNAITPRENANWTRWNGMPAGKKSLVSVLKHTFNNFSPDHRGLFTAATSLRALHQISKYEGAQS